MDDKTNFTSQEILEGIKNGNEKAKAALYKQYKMTVSNILKNKGVDHQDIDDIFHIWVIKVIEGINNGIIKFLASRIIYFMVFKALNDFNKFYKGRALATDLSDDPPNNKDQEKELLNKIICKDFLDEVNSNKKLSEALKALFDSKSVREASQESEISRETLNKRRKILAKILKVKFGLNDEK